MARMRFHSRFGPAIGALWRGARLRCPACGRGRLFDRGFHLRPTCPYCEARFERSSGESLGAVYINSALTIVPALVGFFAVETAWHPPMVAQLVAWTLFVVLFPAWTFRLARGVWVAVAYLTGGVYPDPDYEREWMNPQVRPRRQPTPTDM